VEKAARAVEVRAYSGFAKRMNRGFGKAAVLPCPLQQNYGSLLNDKTKTENCVIADMERMNKVKHLYIDVCSYKCATWPRSEETQAAVKRRIPKSNIKDRYRLEPISKRTRDMHQISK
jgi:hypothetical protein